MHPVDISALRAKLDNFGSSNDGKLPLRAEHVTRGSPSEIIRTTIFDARGREVVSCLTDDPVDLDSDFAELIAAAVNALPGLFDEVERLAKDNHVLEGIARRLEVEKDAGLEKIGDALNAGATGPRTAPNFDEAVAMIKYRMELIVRARSELFEIDAKVAAISRGVADLEREKDSATFSLHLMTHQRDCYIRAFEHNAALARERLTRIWDLEAQVATLTKTLEHYPGTPEADRLELRAQLGAEREKVRQLEEQVAALYADARERHDA